MVSGLDYPTHSHHLYCSYRRMIHSGTGYQLHQHSPHHYPPNKNCPSPPFSPWSSLLYLHLHPMTEYSDNPNHHFLIETQPLLLHPQGLYLNFVV
uniref:Uncharacterized protein n=1 Tax=Rhizophora mucronata TaxID=61149 RepID=A0A2P2LEF9_RHIMU